MRQFMADLARQAESVQQFLESERQAFLPLSSELGDLSDIPKELLSELTIPQGDELEMQILSVIKAFGGTAALDQILVGLFRRFKLVQKRRFVSNKLWRMTQKGVSHPISGKRGIYTLGPAPETEAEFQVRISEMDDEIPF
jgi:hypothetical protein